MGGFYTWGVLGTFPDIAGLILFIGVAYYLCVFTILSIVEFFKKYHAIKILTYVILIIACIIHAAVGVYLYLDYKEGETRMSNRELYATTLREAQERAKISLDEGISICSRLPTTTSYEPQSWDCIAQIQYEGAIRTGDPKLCLREYRFDDCLEKTLLGSSYEEILSLCDKETVSNDDSDGQKLEEREDCIRTGLKVNGIENENCTLFKTPNRQNWCYNDIARSQKNVAWCYKLDIDEPPNGYSFTDCLKNSLEGYNLKYIQAKCASNAGSMEVSSTTLRNDKNYEPRSIDQCILYGVRANTIKLTDCSMFTSPEYLNVCYSDVAESLRDPSWCDKMDDKEDAFSVGGT